MSTILRRARTKQPWSRGHACLFGLVGLALAWSLWLLIPGTFASLDWALYDRWLAWRQAMPVSPEIVVVTRDQESEARFGHGEWDRAVLARIIRSVDQAGASVVGIDGSFETPSPPVRGGAASDVILSEALRSAGNLVLALPSTAAPPSNTSRGEENVGAAFAPLATQPESQGTGDDPLPPFLLPHGSSSARERVIGFGHQVVLPEADGVVRRVPLFVQLGSHRIPAFGLALADVFLFALSEREVRAMPVSLGGSPAAGISLLDTELPAGGDGHMLVNFPAAEGMRGFTSLSFLTVWTAIEGGHFARLREWMEGKVVVLAVSGGPRLFRTPLSDRYSDADIQINLLNTILTGRWLNPAPPLAAWVMAFLVSAFGAWLMLSRSGWRGPVSTLGLAGAYIALALVLLIAGGLVLPLATPLGALVTASGGAMLWTQLRATRRVERLGQDMEGVQRELNEARHRLVVQESAVEGLEEDLEATRAALSASEGKEADLVRDTARLQAQCSEAGAREEATRRRVEELQQALDGLRIADVGGGRKGDARLGRWREECERLGITAREPGMLALFGELKKAARSSISVLLNGEPGTGKELFARALHRLSPRAEKPFVAVNMAAISPELFESELFGHVKGSFTGAVGSRKGFFEVAHEGTIFLDEIGELRYEHQAKLLRVLQDKVFFRVGDTSPTKVDIRVVAATNKNLSQGVAQGSFREDLYFRLKGIVLQLPPLRKRRLDLPVLADQMVRDAALEEGRAGLGLSREALAALEAHSWPGNVRELRQCLSQAVALAEGAVITKEDLRLGSDESTGSTARQKEAVLSSDSRSDQAVLVCLLDHELDMKATARALEWDRSTVTQRLKGLGFRALVEARGDQSKAALALAGDPALAKKLEAKLYEYYQHLLQTIRSCETPGQAISVCRRRFKNLPDRHLKSVELLVHQYFERPTHHHSLGPS